MAKTGSEKPKEQVVSVPEPQTSSEYITSGWSHYGKREFYRAEADFRKALENVPDDVEANYALALCLNASGRPQEAAKIFDRVVQMAESVPPEENVRAHMFSRLAKDHLFWLKSGETSPEKK